MKFKIEWTLSKIAAFSVLTLGAVSAFVFSNAEHLVTAFMCTAILIGVKTGTTAMVDVKNGKASFDNVKK